MAISKTNNLILLVLLSGTMACSISIVSQQARTLQQASQAIRTDVGSFISAGDSLINTAQAIATEYPDILDTAKSLGTHGAPLITTIQAASTNNHARVEATKVLLGDQIHTSEPLANIPILERQSISTFVGSSQYIIYTTPDDYEHTLSFYTTEMPNNEWIYMESEFHMFAKGGAITIL